MNWLAFLLALVAGPASSQVVNNAGDRPPPAAVAASLGSPAGTASVGGPVAGGTVSAIPDLTPVAGRADLLAAGVPEVPEALAREVSPLLETRSARLLDVTAGGDAVLIATRLGESSQLHVVEQPLGMRTQITFGREPISQGAFHPADRMVVFYLQEADGSESFRIYRLDRRQGRPELFTDGRSPQKRFVLSPDGGWIAWSGIESDGDCAVYAAETGNPREVRLLVRGKAALVPVDFSSTGGQLLVERVRSAADADLLLVDVPSGERLQLTPTEGKGSIAQARFSADGKEVFVVTDRYGDFNELYRIDLAQPEAPPRPLSRTIRWDVEGLAVARDGSRLALVVNADGVSRLYLLEPKNGKLEPGNVPAGVAGGLRFPAKTGSSLFLDLASPRSPGDVWQLDLKARKLLRWTRSEIGGLDSAALAEPALVHYPGADGLEIQALLYRPKGPGPKPLVILWHGEPEGQERPTFHPLAQILVERGIAVLLPNGRGSRGYGKAYLAMDDGPKREQALSDIGATLDFVRRQPDLDPSRVAAFGGSYGGYLALATAAFYPDRVRSAVDFAGISSIPSFLESAAAHRDDRTRAEYGDERDPAVRAVQERISPLNHLEAIRAALLVIQGRNDPGVPQTEAEQIVAAVRRQGGEVWYLLALDEGHGFERKGNRDQAIVTAVFFLEQTLRGDPAGPRAPR